MLARFVLLCLLTVISTTSVTAAELKPFKATYQVVKYDLLLGEIEVRLEQEGNRLIYSKKSRTKGLAALFRNEVIWEKSNLLLTNNHLMVLDYNYKLERGDKTRENSFVFKAPDKVVGVYKKKPFSLKVPQGALDRSSVELALMQNAGQNIPKLSYSMIEKGLLKSYNFSLQDTQTADTPAGQFECYNYKVIRNSGKRSTTLCLAPKINNLPVIIKHNEKGTDFHMLLKSYSFNNDGS